MGSITLVLEVLERISSLEGRMQVLTEQQNWRMIVNGLVVSRQQTVLLVDLDDCGELALCPQVEEGAVLLELIEDLGTHKLRRDTVLHFKV